LNADRPELAHELLARVPRVVGHERDPLSRLAQRHDRVRRARYRVRPHPDAPVEIEDDLLVALEEGGEKHGGRTLDRYSAAPMRRLLPALAVLAVAAAGCGSSKSSSTAAIPSGAGKPQTSVAVPAAKGCKAVAGAPKPRKPGKQKNPTAALDTSKAWTLDFKTSCGSFTVRLDLKRGPHAS